MSLLQQQSNLHSVQAISAPTTASTAVPRTTHVGQSTGSKVKLTGSYSYENKKLKPCIVVNKGNVLPKKVSISDQTEIKFFHFDVPLPQKPKQDYVVIDMSFLNYELGEDRNEYYLDGTRKHPPFFPPESDFFMNPTRPFLNTKNHGWKRRESDEKSVLNWRRIEV